MSDKKDVTNVDSNEITKFATHEKGKFETEAHDKEYMELTLKAGEHGDIARKILKQRIEQRALEFPRWPSSDSSGARLLWIESRFWYDRERLGPDFDDDWRKYRAKYLHSLNLDPREPVYCREYELEMINPIRRFYQKGGDFIEKHFIKRFLTKDKYTASTRRIQISRLFFMYIGAVSIYYYLRYNHMNWERNCGWRLDTSHYKVLPGHPQYPFKDWKTKPAHHSDLGFSKRSLYVDLRDFVDNTELL